MHFFANQKYNNMKKITTLLLLLCCAYWGMAQNTISGKLIDADTGDPLIGATILLSGTQKGTTSDIDGNFILESVPKGEQKIIITYLGYQEQEMPFSVSEDINTGSLKLKKDDVVLDEIAVIADIAVDRKTPVAVSTINLETIESKLGNNEFPEILNKTPSIFATKGGGGFGDARINIRGFNQRNSAVLINGIPVNDMENGWVYWSNWAGLSDVTRQMQVQRGLGASKLAISSVGGTINIVTKTTDQKRGGNVSVGVGNDGYAKFGALFSTGLLDSGWAFTFQGTRTMGRGYIDANYIDAWSYFGAISKQINERHQLAFTAIGAPQKHGQRSYREDLSKYVTAPESINNISDNDSMNVEFTQFIKDSKVADFNDRIDTTFGSFSPLGNVRYNSDWGIKDGEIFNLRENFYHKPQFALNHYWDVNSNLFIGTSAYYSLGRGGGTGDIGSIDGKRIYQFSKDKNGLYRIEDYIAWNSGSNNVEGFPEVGNVADSLRGHVTSWGNGIVKRASMNEHNWFGVLSKAEFGISENLNLIGGIDLRKYVGLHYRKAIDLMGSDVWLDRDDVNTPEKYVIADDKLAGNPGEDGKIDYDSDGRVGWQGAFAELEYSKEQLTAFVSGAISNTSYVRIDRFDYLKDSDLSTTGQYNFLGYTAKAGANFNINQNNNIFLNAGYITKAPIFDSVFPENSNNIDDINADALNEKIVGLELGYGYRSKSFKANLNLYRTNWQDKAFNDSYFDETTEMYYFYNVIGIDALHQGIEVDVAFAPVKGLNLLANVSLGDWKWKNEGIANVFNDRDSLVAIINVYADGLKVGDAAQTSFYLGADYKFDFGLGLDAGFVFRDKYYTEFDITEIQEKPENIDDAQPLLLPSYGLLDAGVSYTIKLNNDSKIRLRLNLDNVLDELYVADAEDDDNLYKSNGLFGFGRTWNASVKYYF